MTNPSYELFAAHAKTLANVRDVRTACKVAGKLGTSKLTILAYGDLIENPWFCFDVGERKFAIWTNTGKLYECNPDGSVPEDPIELDGLVASPSV